MAEDDLMFDPSKKKKKKKPKRAFEDDEMVEPEKQKEDSTITSTEIIETKVSDEITAITDDFDDLLNKKKKKKSKKVIFDNETTDNKTEDIDTELKDEELFEGKKKKKKTRITLDSDIIDGSTTIKGKDSGLGMNIDSDRDYTYDELLQRVFDIMREKNPDMIAGEKKRFVMKPPQVMRAGTKKTSFSNFAEICKTLHRQPKHLLAFLLAELGTSGSIDGSNQLIIKGRFQQKQIEVVLRRYIKEYVTCHTCKSPDTILQKDTRLYFLQCEVCGSRCSVTSIKSGFQAVTSKRAAMRAKTN